MPCARIYLNNNDETKKLILRQLLGRYYSEPNGAAILLGRVDLRVDHGHFRNHMKIQESPRADNPVRFFRICYGRHGGRPSQEQQANSTLPT